jgi:hypothetical protein
LRRHFLHLFIVFCIGAFSIFSSGCGPDPITLTLSRPAKVFNDANPDIVIENSVITDNIGGSWYPAYDGISMHSDTPISVTDSIIEYNSQG